MPRGDTRTAHGRAHSGTGHPQGPARQPLSAEQQQALETLLGQVSELATQLRGVTQGHREDFVTPLASIRDAEEPVALAFAMRLGELRGAPARDAVEVAQALGELDPRPEVAREARRSRLRLRSSGAMPTLTIPPLAAVPGAAALAGSAGVAPPEAESTFTGPQLTEAHISRTRESGELTLVLGWQEGADPDYVRGMLFELDFYHDGVRRFAQTETMRRRRFLQETVEKIRAGDGTTGHVPTTTVTWAQARRLIREALEVNEWRGNEPAAEFRQQRALLDKRLLQGPDDDETRAAITAEDERAAHEGDRPFIATDLEPDETVANWIGAWSFGDYGLTYDLLGDEHPLRRKQTRAEYIALRRQWQSEAEPDSLRLTLVREQEQRASGLWVPGAAGGLAAGGARDVEAFWSLDLQDTPVAGQLDEMPMATIQSGISGRHWYWTAYTLQRDRTHGLWVIARNRDEGLQSQSLPIEELQKRIAEARATAEKIAQEAPPNPQSQQAIEAIRGMTGAITSALHYSDALIVRLPLDESVYRTALDDARSLANHERAVALLERMGNRFADAQKTRFELGIEEWLVGEQLGQQGQTEMANVWVERSLATLAQVAEEDRTAEHLQALGELLARRGRIGQAEARMREALELDPDRASLYADLAAVVMARASGEDLDSEAPPTPEQRDQMAREALSLLRQAAKLDAGVPHLFTRIGAIYEVLHQHEDARIAFEEAVRRDPGDDEAQYTLGALLLARNEPAQALPLLERAVQLQPITIPYRLSLAQCYIMLERKRDASRELDVIEKLSPHLPQVSELRAQIGRIGKKK